MNVEDVIVFFEYSTNEWYFNTIIDNKKERIYLNIFFDDNREKAQTRAQKIMKILQEKDKPYEDKNDLIENPEGLLLEQEEDFRVLIP